MEKICSYHEVDELDPNGPSRRITVAETVSLSRGIFIAERDLFSSSTTSILFSQIKNIMCRLGLPIVVNTKFAISLDLWKVIEEPRDCSVGSQLSKIPLRHRWDRDRRPEERLNMLPFAAITDGRKYVGVSCFQMHL